MVPLKNVNIFNNARSNSTTNFKAARTASTIVGNDDDYKEGSLPDHIDRGPERDGGEPRLPPPYASPEGPLPPHQGQLHRGQDHHHFSPS